MGRKPLIGCGLLFVTAVLAVLHLDDTPREELQRLLHGGGSVEMTSFVVTGQGRTIELNDPESLRYLTAAFRAAEKEGYVPSRNGTSYYANVRFRTTWSVLIGVSAADETDDANGFTVGYPMDSLGDPTYYWVRFPRPRPAAVEAALVTMGPQPAHRRNGRGG